MQAFFLSGTDTDIGKTVVAAWLALHWQADYWKPIQSGLAGETDSQTVARLSLCNTHPEAYQLRAPLSPHQSAQLDGKHIELQQITLPNTQRLIAEGAGGLMVPLNETTLIIDLIAHLKLPVVLVSKSGLGTINHTVLSALALRQRNIPCLGIIVVGPHNPDNLKAIEQFTSLPVLAQLPQLNDISHHALQSLPIPKKLEYALKTLPSLQNASPRNSSINQNNQNKLAQSLIERDQKHCWHPFTQAKIAANPLAIVRGEGALLYDSQGTAYLDAVSSWWVNLHGHANPAIAQAIAQQAHKLEHTMFAGITHPPAIELAERLIAHGPPSMQYVFFSDNGSTAVEVALKMACQYWHNTNPKGHQRRRFLAMRGAYHGDTFGAMATGRSSGFYPPFEPWLFKTDFLPSPYHWLGRNENEQTAEEEQTLHCLERYLEKHSDGLVAFIIEPLVQGASGMRMMRSQFVAKLVKRVKAAGIPVIFDEVMTGFGRTGKWFASHHLLENTHISHRPEYLSPDIMCISKGLTGGFLPMGATLCTSKMYSAFYADTVEQAFLHGHSYTANPLGCAAALANIELLEKETVWNEIRAQACLHTLALEKLALHPAIEQVRQCGTIAALDLKAQNKHYGSSTSQWLREALIKKGILTRPLGHTLYLIAPYCTTTEQLNWAYQQIEQVLNEWNKNNKETNKVQIPGAEFF